MSITVRNYKTPMFILLLLCLTGCSRQEQEEQAVLARINDFNLTLDDYEFELSRDVELDNDFKITTEAKKEFLEEMIRKQLLVQEAKRLRLDTKEQFVRTIQQYWESTLIRDLLDLKGKEITGRIYVSEDEIAARYEDMARSITPTAPLQQVRQQILEELKEDKKTAMLEAWVVELRQKATVHIEEGLLLNGETR